MSRIYFHSPSGEAELPGRERAYAQVMISDLCKALLRVAAQDEPNHPSGLRQLLPPDSYVLQARDFEQAFQLWFGVSFDGYLLMNGRRLDPFTLQLNTALTIGGDPLRLLVRLHGQCEIHAWVDGANRAWLASIMQDALDQQVLRPDEGWEQVIPFLRSRSDEPVVLSYSVTDQFPNQHVAKWRDDRDGDDWYDLSAEQQWTMAMEKLRAQNGLLEMKPETWSEIRFGGGESFFTVLNHLRQLDKAQS